MSRYLGALCCLLLCACGGEATARLAFEDDGANALTTFSPSQFRMKLIAAYLAEDIDPSTYNNVGMTAMFYLNPTCGDDIMHCDISTGAAEDGGVIDKVVSEFFDFSPGVDVNAALNAQANPITPSSYRYVRLEFCKYNHGSAANVAWSGQFEGAIVDNATFTQNSCTVNSARMEPPLTLADGDATTVTLSYSLANAVNATVGSGGGSNCVSVSGTSYCFTVPSFTPSAAR